MPGTAEGAQRTAAKRAGLSVDEYRAKVAAGLKRCTRCKAWKPRARFDLDNSRGDGLKAGCIDCTRVKDRKRHIGPASATERNRASEAVRQAIKAGRMVRPNTLPCADCGKPARHYHHHLGYDRRHWLDVVALCVSCHHRRHWV